MKQQVLYQILIRTAIKHNKVLLVFSIYATFQSGRPSSGPTEPWSIILLKLIKLSVVDGSMYANIWYNTPQWDEFHPKRRQKEVLSIMCLCIPALVIQHANHIVSHCIILSSVACLARPQFSTLTQKHNDFFRTNYWTQMCVLIVSTTFVWNISHSKKNSVRYNKFT
jgi:hypothetical protein